MATKIATVAAPSPAEIRRRCREIQTGWSEDTRRKRSVFKVEPWMMKALEVHYPSRRERNADDDYGRVA
jgi:hypothetical protein